VDFIWVFLAGAALLAVEEATVGLIRGFVERLRSWLSRRLRADHVAIAGAWHQRDLATLPEFVITIAYAPSKSIRQERLDAAEVEEWVRASFDGLFPTNPEWCDPTELIRYRREPDERSRFAAFALARPCGLREVALPVPYSLDVDSRPQLALMDLAGPLLRFAREVQGGGRGWIAGRSRVDWHIGVSRALDRPTWTPWAGLIGPGRTPAGRATNAEPPITAFGLGHRHLRGVARRTPPVSIVMWALSDLVERAGYYGLDDALVDLRRAVEELDEVLR
jgi:hypothetical protein